MRQNESPSGLELTPGSWTSIQLPGFFMSKYSVQFKKRAVILYLHDGLSFVAVAKKMGASPSDVRMWVACFRAHGVAGLEKKHSSYTPAFKVQALEQMTDQSLSARAVAAKLNIRNPSAIRLWRRAYDEGGIEALMPKPRGRAVTMKQKPPAEPIDPRDTPTVEQLLKENEYLRAEVAYLKKLDALIQAKKPAAQKKRK